MERGKTLIGVMGGLVSGLAIMAGTLAVIRTLRTPPPGPAIPSGRVRVAIKASLPTAQILVDNEFCGSGKCELTLRPGVHQAEASKPGYAGETQEFAASAGLQVELGLQPLPSAVEVVTDLVNGTLRLDNQPAVLLGGGGAQLTGVEPGEHQLQFSSGAFQAAFKLEMQAGAAPKLLTPPSVRGLRAIVVGGAGSSSRLWVSDKSAELSIGARELGFVPEEGIALPALERGSHRFLLKPGEGKEIGFAYETTESPTAWISLRTNRRLGTLRVTAAPDDAKVILDGKDSGARIRRGRALLLAAPGRHEVGVEMAGFLSPSEQRAIVVEGGESELVFTLAPVPTRALLPITGAPPGTVFSIDGRPAGMTGADGSLTVGDLNPGLRAVTARRDGYLPGRWEVKLGAGRNAALRGALSRAPATLRIVVVPAGAEAKVSIRRLGEFDERAVKETVLTLTEGEYTVTAVDAKSQRTTTRVRVEAGKEATATLTLSAPLER